MRTANPALKENTFDNLPKTQGSMTVQGTVNKSLFLILLVVISAYFSWQASYPDGWSIDSKPAVPEWYFIALILGLVVSLVIIFKRTTAPFLTPVYALLEGVTLGTLSALFEARYPGIVMQAVMCTFGTFFSLLLAYKSQMIRASENFKLGVVAATGGIAFVYLIDIIISFFGKSVPLIHDNGPVGVSFSIGITIVAALNLVLDFDFIEKVAQQGAPKYMEWYASFGLLVTLVWLYVEFLRLLSKSHKR